MDVLTTPRLPLAEWLSIIEREYLAEYVPAGGGAVKFAILDDAAIDTAAERLVGLGQARAMLTVHLEAGRTRIHLMQELLFAIARALPWDSLVQRYLEALFGDRAYAWPRPGEAMTVAELAAAFAVAPNLLSHHVDRWLTADLWETGGWHRISVPRCRGDLRRCRSRPSRSAAAGPGIGLRNWAHGS